MVKAAVAALAIAGVSLVSTPACARSGIAFARPSHAAPFPPPSFPSPTGIGGSVQVDPSARLHGHRGHFVHDRHWRYPIGGWSGGWGYGGGPYYPGSAPSRDMYGYFGDGGETYDDGGHAYYDYDRGYPYDWYRPAEPRHARVAGGMASDEGVAAIHCEVESVPGGRGGHTDVRVCRGR